MTVRAKMNCEQKTVYPGKRAEVILKPVTTGSEENKEFYSYTPSGEVKLTMLNESAAAQFEPGKAYYVDFTPAE